MEKARIGRMVCLAIFCVASAAVSVGQTLTTLVNLNDANGYMPYYGPLVQGLNGNFYGTTVYGGGYDSGNVFEVSQTGKITNLHSFCASTGCPDGAYPQVGLTLAPNGHLYGTTSNGGANGAGGTIFEIVPGGQFNTLYSFCPQITCVEGGSPQRLVIGHNGHLYGTASLFGAYGAGTVFEVTPAGRFTTLYSFCAKMNAQVVCADGATPSPSLVIGADGNFYGATQAGGQYCNNHGYTPGCGTFFKMTPQGELKSYALFNGSNGHYPSALLQGTDGSFYGTTMLGGTTNCGYSDGCGTAFQITPNGDLTTLYNFCAQSYCADGSNPWSLMLATDGNLYGTADGENGIVFQLTPSGSITTLYAFCQQCNSGLGPVGTLLQSTNGTFYSTTAEGLNSQEYGTVYSLSTGLGSFIESNPTFGKVGYNIPILGNHLTGTNSVTFNGTAATFTVVSDTYIKAQVPTGATTGTIEVTTPSGTLSSNVAFQVIP